jgi:ABC-type branched-subunit amino acid transport system substrate-binding protein
MFRRVRGALALLFATAVLAGPATPQGALEGSLRIGFILPAVPEDATEEWQRAVAVGAEHGAILGIEEQTFNAQLFDIDFDVAFATAAGPVDVVAAAERLFQEEGIYAVIGGYSTPEAIALGTWAEQRNIPFVNVGAQADVLRNDLCLPMTFHVQPSAAMYLDALAGWYVRAGFRRWYIVQSADTEGAALHERLSWALDNRHFGANEVGTTVLDDTTDTGAELRSAIERSRADLLVLLVDAGEQLRVMSDLDAAGLTLEVAGYPFPETESRDYLVASREAAPNLGTDHRASAWEATIDAYGAREYNARHRLRWDSEPQDAAAWAAFHAVKILFEAALFGGSTDGIDLAAYMVNQSSVFDLHKGIAVTFRPWDHQLRQSLFLVKISETADNAFDMALLVGELPAIYMPGTDPEERLDQLGDLASHSTCRF